MPDDLRTTIICPIKSILLLLRASVQGSGRQARTTFARACAAASLSDCASAVNAMMMPPPLRPILQADNT